MFFLNPPGCATPSQLSLLPDKFEPSGMNLDFRLFREELLQLLP
jgi:hypothetical protein